jgi:hypothetical protein
LPIKPLTDELGFFQGVWDFHRTRRNRGCAGVTVKNCTVTGFEAGISVFVANNEFNRNGEHGICVIPGNTDGGGNTGHLNALPPDVTFSGGC